LVEEDYWAWRPFGRGTLAVARRREMAAPRDEFVRCSARRHHV